MIRLDRRELLATAAPIAAALAARWIQTPPPE
jgi:hypothetical protein